MTVIAYYLATVYTQYILHDEQLCIRAVKLYFLQNFHAEFSFDDKNQIQRF